MSDPDQLTAVAARLAELRDDVVFLGGVVVELLVTDPAAPPPRPTDDVDFIVEMETHSDFHELGQRLRRLGFTEDDREGAPLCRWVVDGITVDAMPTSPVILGFSNGAATRSSTTTRAWPASQRSLR